MARAVSFLTVGLQPGKEMSFGSLSTKGGACPGGEWTVFIPVSLGLHPRLGLAETPGNAVESCRLLGR